MIGVQFERVIWSRQQGAAFCGGLPIPPFGPAQGRDDKYEKVCSLFRVDSVRGQCVLSARGVNHEALHSSVIIGLKGDADRQFGNEKIAKVLWAETEFGKTPA